MSIPHGTRSKYTNHGCRCNLCREANTRYKREFRAKYGRYASEYSSKQVQAILATKKKRK